MYRSLKSVIYVYPNFLVLSLHKKYNLILLLDEKYKTITCSSIIILSIRNDLKINLIILDVKHIYQENRRNRLGWISMSEHMKHVDLNRMVTLCGYIL